MNGAQDLGGMTSFGPVRPERDEPIFHQAWERRAFGLVMAMGATGEWTLDARRFSRESLPPAEYYAASYYEIWIKGLIRDLLADGLVSVHELFGDQPPEPGKPVKRVVAAGDVDAILAAGTPYDRPATAPARFGEGDALRVRNDHPATHTRAPRYVRGRVGRVVAVRGVFVYPDSSAHGGGEDPHWLYTLRFSATELWGSAADAASSVMVDLFEPYLEPA
jgi:nitrile hydratase subunit beta